MAYLRFTLWISLLFYDLHFFGAECTRSFENVRTLEKYQLNDHFHHESTNKIIVKRNTDPVASPQIFKFELDDAKEPDEETKKLIQTRARELQLKETNVEVVNMTVSKRSKRAAQKIKPKLIPFLISDAKEPDDATKELIRRSRAKELSVTANKEPTNRKARHKASSEVTQKREPSRQSRGKIFAASTIENKEPFRQGRVKSITLTTESKKPLRQGKVQSVPLTGIEEDFLRENIDSEVTPSTTSQNRQRSKTRTKRKRTRRSAQLTEPRYIKFELQDVKDTNSENRAELQMIPRPIYGAKILTQIPEPRTSQDDSDDSSGQGSKYRYFIHQAPRKVQYALYPKQRYEHNDVVFRVSKMQKYMASGQGLENINTNIEITLPPTATATAILSGYPKQVYGQKICPYGAQGCQFMGPLAPAVAPVQLPPPVQQNHQNLVSENEVLPEHQHQQLRYYYNIYPQPPPQPEVHQQFIPIAKPPSYQIQQQIVHAPIVEQQLQQNPQQQPQQQEPQVAQNLIDDRQLTEQNPSLNVAYLQPTYGYGNKLYPYTIAKNVQPQPANEQNAIQQIDGGNNQENLQNKNNQADQINLLKNNQEFQELSALIGKSPMDQVHGLSYLLAKEMQRQKSANGNHQRPQDQTSPILFHPKENTSGTSTQVVQNQVFENPKTIENNQIVPFQPLRTLHKNSATPAPAVQADVQKAQVTSEVSFSVGKAIGLSPNYNGINGNNNSPKKIYSEAENDSTMGYASKYAFGYRVRDFHSGNDFAHKQNRDVDGVIRGQYHILMPDGRIQNVVYYADDTGYHADMLY